MTMQKCPGCQRTLPSDSYSVDRSRKTGLKSRCKDCDNARSRVYYGTVRGPVGRAARGFVPKGTPTCSCGNPKAYHASRCSGCAGNKPKECSKPRFYIPEHVRQAVFKRDDWVCWLCGTYVDTICGHNDELAPTIDHVIPRSKGGGHEMSNLRTAHRNCNGKRGNRVA